MRMDTYAIRMNVLIICVVAFAAIANGEDVGDSCQVARSGADGICKLFNDCQVVINELVNQGLYPAACGYRGREQIVCCPVPPTTPKPVVTLAPTRISQKSKLIN